MPTISTLTVDVESNTSKFSKGLKLATAGLGALAVGAAFAFKQFEDSEKIAAQTDAVLKSTGHSANITAKGVTDLATALSKKTAIDDEAIQAGENMLLTFTNIRNEVGKGNDIFNQATKTVTDMSVALGQDFKSSAIQLGKALNDPVAGITALQRVGVSFDEATKKQIDTLVKHGQTLEAQKIILGELNKEFGGSAKAQATASAQMGVALGNLAETIGGLLAPAINKVLGFLTQFATFVQETVVPAAKAFWTETIVPLAQSLAQNLGPALQGIAEWFQKVFDAVVPVAEAFGRELLEAAQQVWRVLQSNLGPMLKAIWNVLQDLWHIVEPVVKVWLAIQAVWVKIALEVLPVLLAVITKLVEIAADIIDAFLKVVGWFKDHFVDPIIGFFQRVVDWIKEKFMAAWDAVKGPVGAVIDFWSGKIETLIGWIKSAIGWLSALGSGVSDALAGTGIEQGVFSGINVGNHPSGPRPGHIPHGASGGFISKSGLAVIHKGEHLIPAGSGGGSTVIVQGWVGTPQETARKIRDELNKLAGRNAGSRIS